MSVNDIPLSLNAEQLISQIPGVIFQFFLHHDGHMAFPFMEGAGMFVASVDRDQLAKDANSALEQLAGADFPKLMSAIEHSARSMQPLTTRFRLTLLEHKTQWIGVSATPERMPDGVRWHGIMMDISDQVSEEQRLRKLCDTDPLTSLPNRRKLMVHLTHLASLSSRHGTPLSIMMLDIDHFKHVNDRWGHLKGDEILTQLAIVSQSLLRSEDMLARLGGEEFMAVLPLTPIKQCHQLADRLRHRIAEHNFGVGAGKITLSIGIAEYRCGEPLESLIDRADQALYSAKDVGRDCVCLLS